MGEVQGTEQCSRLPGGQLGRLAVHHRVFLAAHGGKRVQSDGVARHQNVEKMPQRRQRQILGGVRSGQFLNETPGHPRRDLTELAALFFAPEEKAPHGAGIGTAGVGVGYLGREELIGGEQRVLARPLQEGREGHRTGGRWGSAEVSDSWAKV